MACDDIRRYQPDPGKAYCRICNGEVSQNATKCKTGAYTKMQLNLLVLFRFL